MVRVMGRGTADMKGIGIVGGVGIEVTWVGWV